MDVNKKILDMSNSRGWSMYDLANEAGLTQSTLSSMFQRNTPPKIDTLQRICDAFGITLAQFFADGEQLEFLSSDEKQLVDSFRKLSKDRQKALLDLI